MESKQIKLLISLAKKLKEEKRDIKDILNTFVSAGILTKNGSYTKNYQGLKSMEK
jgi:hypothetical protein